MLFSKTLSLFRCALSAHAQLQCYNRLTWSYASIIYLIFHGFMLQIDFCTFICYSNSLLWFKLLTNEETGLTKLHIYLCKWMLSIYKYPRNFYLKAPPLFQEQPIKLSEHLMSVYFIYKGSLDC
jgi:hypothetical protein